MKRIFLATFLVMLCASFASASIFVNGNGKLVVKTVEIPTYNIVNLGWVNKIVINDSTDITPLRDKTFVEGQKVMNWKQGANSALTIKTDENLIPHIKVEVTGDGVMSIDIEENYFIRPTYFEINTSSAQLDGLSILGKFETHLLSPVKTETFTIKMQGAGKLVAENGIDVRKGTIDLLGTGEIAVSSVRADDFSADIKGSSVLSLEDIEAGTVNVSSMGSSNASLVGKCNGFSCNVIGKGSVVASSLVANDVKCIVKDRGKAKINAEKSLFLEASGRGSIEYFGNGIIKSSEKYDFGKIKKGK